MQNACMFKACDCVFKFLETDFCSANMKRFTSFIIVIKIFDVITKLRFSYTLIFIQFTNFILIEPLFMLTSWQPKSCHGIPWKKCFWNVIFIQLLFLNASKFLARHCQIELAHDDIGFPISPTYRGTQSCRVHFSSITETITL
jgi:hypothetical protein